MLEPVLSAYALSADNCYIQSFGSGLINRTWKVSNGNKEYILQRINHQVFKTPEGIAENIRLLSAWLQQHFPEYLFVEPITTTDNNGLVLTGKGEYFRLMPFVPGSSSCDVVRTPSMALEGARQFGRFTRLLSGFPAQQLHITLPDFHNLSLRYQQFEAALEKGNPQRIEEAREHIAGARQYRHLVTTYESILKDPGFTTRVTHHDTKISNVLFDKEGRGLCVIDLDTVMPGYFISDFGDMMRTYLSPVSEEETDFSQIAVREDYFKAIVHGYVGEMKEELSDAETDHLVYAGQYMIYMQALRFLTDYLNNDSYYGARYEGHNLVRAGNQLCLLQRLTEKEGLLKKIVEHHLQSQV
jgi:Ser/Thr protein kinase RdoA (MazF antagonist)